MKLLLDTSVVFPFFINEENSLKVREIFTSDNEIWFLDFTLVEAANSFASAVRRKRINQQQAEKFFSALILLAENVIIGNQYLSMALSLALKIDHSVYDCLYAIAAHENDAILITSDAKFATKLEDLEINVRLI